MTTPTDSEAIRQGVADALPAIIYSATPTLRLEFANARAVSLFDITANERTDHGWLDLVHPQDRGGVLGAPPSDGHEDDGDVDAGEDGEDRR